MNLLIENLITDFSKVSQQLPEKLLLLEESDLYLERKIAGIQRPSHCSFKANCSFVFREEAPKGNR